MGSDRVVLCGGGGGAATPVFSVGGKITKLSLSGPDQNVNLRLDDISENTAANLPDVLLDLLEIAAYVYSADQAASRGGEGVLDVGARWRRDFRFFIPVRKPLVWTDREVYDELTTTLNLLSEDTYAFTFCPAVHPIPLKQYLEGAVARSEIDQVMLFSGGLDSLGGFIQEAVVEKRQIALVSHRSAPKVDTLQQALVADLTRRCVQNPPLHVPVWVNKGKALGIEATQRTRSFLFSSLAVAVARMFRLSSFRFYENGITSMNLPIAEQLVGARVSRTTHPQVLNGFARLFSMLLQCDFHVENPFFWKTKTDVVNLIGDADYADLIGKTVSCIHTIERTNEHTHCGSCSQCVGRRFATLASRYAGADTPSKYKIDLLTGAREDRPAITLLECLIRTARDMERMGDRKFFGTFGEASRLINHLPGKADDVACRIWSLHRQYGGEVGRVLTAGLSEHAAEFHSGQLPDTCALALAVPEKYKKRRSAAESSTKALQNEPGSGKKRLSERDEQLYSVLGQNLLSTLTNSEILRRTPLIRSFDRNFDPAEPEGIRARLNRIRNYYGLPSSQSLRKYPGNPPTD